MNHFTEAAVTIVLALVALALASVVISKNSNFPADVQAVSSGLGNNIATAISPVTGASVTANLSYPGASSFGSGFGS